MKDLFIESPADYATAFLEGSRVKIPTESTLMGRVLRGCEANDFTQLAADGRKLVFIMGADGLSILPGRPLREALATIGLMPDYVQGRLDQGYSFKLAIFRASERAVLATWDNVLNQVIDCYPDLESDIHTHRKLLSATPFRYFAERMAPHDLDEIDLAGREHSLFMSLERYRAIPSAKRLTDGLALRRMLRHEVRLGPLFFGDGYTRLPNSGHGITEYVLPNGPIAELPAPVIIDLPPS